MVQDRGIVTSAYGIKSYYEFMIYRLAPFSMTLTATP